MKGLDVAVSVFDLVLVPMLIITMLFYRPILDDPLFALMAGVFLGRTGKP